MVLKWSKFFGIIGPAKSLKSPDFLTLTFEWENMGFSDVTNFTCILLLSCDV